MVVHIAHRQSSLPCSSVEKAGKSMTEINRTASRSAGAQSKVGISAGVTQRIS